MREHHPSDYAEVAPRKPERSVERTLSEVTAKSSKYSSSGTQAKQLNRAVAFYLAKDGVPLSTVDKPGFRNLVEQMNPRYQLPTRRHFSDLEIPELYVHVRDYVVMPSLRDADFFSANTDLWTSAVNEPYLTLTVHLIDKDWELQSFCLDTVPLFVDHTGKNIAKAFCDIFDNWQLSTDKLVATTTDSGSNVVSAFKTLKLLRTSCFGHNLDLAIKKKPQRCSNTTCSC